MSRYDDLTGRRFGRLVCLSFEGSDERGMARWKVRCDCGFEFVAWRVNLIQGRTMSCGCYKSERITKLNKDGRQGNKRARLHRFEKDGD